MNQIDKILPSKEEVDELLGENITVGYNGSGKSFILKHPRPFIESNIKDFHNEILKSFAVPTELMEPTNENL